MIEARGLRKSYGNHVVLDGIDLDVAEGTICALLGPNGAGKTATVQILSALMGAGSGTARVAGHAVAREPDAVHWYAEHQPFTPVVPTLRVLLLGTPAADSAVLAIAWCAGIALFGCMLARRVYSRSCRR